MLPSFYAQSVSYLLSLVHNVSSSLHVNPPLNALSSSTEHGLQETSILGALNIQTLVALLVSLVFLSTIASYFRLYHIPGPLFAGLSDIVRFRWVWNRKAHRIHIALHQKYGSIVRIGPNAVSVGDPKEIGQIYAFTGKFKKSNFYSVILPMSKGKILPGLFATQDEALHSMLKKPIAAIYSMSNLVTFESYVDSTIKVFCEQLDARFANPLISCNFSDWLQYFAFDVIGEITFSTRLGFLERGEDVDNIISNIWLFFEYVATVGQMPWIDRLWVKNPWISRLRKPGWNATAVFAQARRKEREQLMAAGDPDGKLNNRDFLSRFLAAQAKDPSIQDWVVLAWAQSNITAGSDTTAIFLRTLFYNLLRHPDTLARLRAELDEAAARGELSSPASWQESRKLPYLGACVKEAGRIHPPFGLHLERVVPPGGAAICGQFIPEGTIVGMNAWVVHRHAATFGEDADEWNPERWLCDDVERQKEMDRSLLTFGAGHRSCIGKNISHLEIFKLVPTLLRRYDIALTNPDKEWDVQNRWFVPQFNFDVKLRLRELEL